MGSRPRAAHFCYRITLSRLPTAGSAILEKLSVDVLESSGDPRMDSKQTAFYLCRSRPGWTSEPGSVGRRRTVLALELGDAITSNGR
jgi:hypothetical protein